MMVNDNIVVLIKARASESSKNSYTFKKTNKQKHPKEHIYLLTYKHTHDIKKQTKKKPLKHLQYYSKSL